MYKYSFSYKYLLVKKDDFTTYIELSIDNFSGKRIIAAKTNLMFKDEFEDWGHACGIGENENEALQMCINELNSYIKGTSLNMNDLINTEVFLPQKFVYENKGQPIVLLINKIDNNWEILTCNGIKSVNLQCDILEYIMKHHKIFDNCGIQDASIEFLAKNGFEKIFDNLTQKHK